MHKTKSLLLLTLSVSLSLSQCLSIHIIIKQFQACQTQKIWPAPELLPKPRQWSEWTLVLHRTHRDSTSGMRTAPMFRRLEFNQLMKFCSRAIRRCYVFLRLCISVIYMWCESTPCQCIICFDVYDLCVILVCVCVFVVECMRCNGETYRGPMDRTESGKECQRWDSQKPHKHTYQPHRYANTNTHNNAHTRHWFTAAFSMRSICTGMLIKVWMTTTAVIPTTTCVRGVTQWTETNHGSTATSACVVCSHFCLSYF